MSARIREIAQEVSELLRLVIIGDLTPPSEGPQIKGLRRSRPQEASEDVAHVEAAFEQAPMPELEELTVELPGPDGEGVEQAVVMDVIPLENAMCRVQGDRITIDFVFCDNYPKHLFDAVPKDHPALTRVVTVPGDPRRELWMMACLEIVQGHLGDEAPLVDFDVDWVSGRYEDLQKDELTLPEG